MEKHSIMYKPPSSSLPSPLSAIFNSNFIKKLFFKFKSKMLYFYFLEFNEKIKFAFCKIRINEHQDLVFRGGFLN